MHQVIFTIERSQERPGLINRTPKKTIALFQSEVGFYRGAKFRGQPAFEPAPQRVRQQAIKIVLKETLHFRFL